MRKCAVPWCGQDLPDDVKHPDHERWAKEIEEGRAVFLAVRNADGSVDVSRWDRGNRR